MIDHISLPVSDLARSRAFYDKALAALGYKVIMEITDAPDIVAAGYGREGTPEAGFWIGASRMPAPPPVTPDGQHIAFRAGPSRAMSTRSTPRPWPPAAATTARPACGRTTIRTTTRPSSSIRTGIGSRPCAICRSESLRQPDGDLPLGRSPAQVASVRASLAPARLHLGFLDLEGGLGRRFGSLGLTIEGLSTRAAGDAGERFAVKGCGGGGPRARHARPSGPSLEPAAAERGHRAGHPGPCRAGLRAPSSRLALGVAAARLAGIDDGAARRSPGSCSAAAARASASAPSSRAASSSTAAGARTACRRR